MKKLIDNSKLMAGVIVLGIFLLSFVVYNPNSGDKKTKWKIPPAAVKMKDPVKATKDNLRTGKTMWAKYCKSCHGKEGKGDGPKASKLKTTCPDFTDGSIAKQTDGTLFFKVSEGKGDMPSFKKKIRAKEDIWTIVNYLKTLDKK